MTEAIIAAIITIIVVLGIACVVVAMRLHSRDESRPAPRSSGIVELENVAVLGKSETPDLEVRVQGGGRHARSRSSFIPRLVGLVSVSVMTLAAVLVRLVQMQVFSSDEYSAQAEENLSSSVATPAARGCIYDKAGRVMVRNRLSQTVLAEPDVAEDQDTIRYLSTVLGLPSGIVRQRLNSTTSGAQNRRVVASDARLRDVAFITEHSDAFSGVTIEERTVRDYPYGALGAHFLGYTGSPTEEELAQVTEGRTIESDDTIGKSGLELFYDSVLAGERGSRDLLVDAHGNVVDVLGEVSPMKGYDLWLTVDAHVQYVADQTLAQLIAPGGNIGTGTGVAGAIVAFNADTGEILAMSSYPTYDPSYFIDGIPQEIWEVYNTEGAHAPMMNRTINGLYAPASTVKPFMALAGLYYGVCSFESSWYCTGSWDGFGEADIQNCWLERGHGGLDLRGGIVNSCDVVFYDIAKGFYDRSPDGTGELSYTALQEFVEQFRLGMTTGVDLDGESEGRIPTPEWKREYWRNVPSAGVWVGGDYTNMIIGQGDTLVSPLQLAVAYGGIATGRIVRPHLLSQVRNNEGDVVYSEQTETVAELDLNQEHLSYVMDALHGVVSENSTTAEAFRDAGLDPTQFSGKSGTAEITNGNSNAWFVALGPEGEANYVVACVIEQGGGGAEIAGPVAARVMASIMDGSDNQAIGYVSGSSGYSQALQYVSSSRED